MKTLKAEVCCDGSTTHPPSPLTEHITPISAKYRLTTTVHHMLGTMTSAA